VQLKGRDEEFEEKTVENNKFMCEIELVCSTFGCGEFIKPSH
jgi:hypothetical protein